MVCILFASCQLLLRESISSLAVKCRQCHRSQSEIKKVTGLSTCGDLTKIINHLLLSELDSRGQRRRRHVILNQVSDGCVIHDCRKEGEGSQCGHRISKIIVLISLQFNLRQIVLSLLLIMRVVEGFVLILLEFIEYFHSIWRWLETHVFRDIEWQISVVN